DLKGWYSQSTTPAVIFTEIAEDEKLAARTISAKIVDGLYARLTLEQINEIRLSFHVFPEDWDDEDASGPATSTLQRTLDTESLGKKVALQIKRLMDIAGSLAALVCL